MLLFAEGFGIGSDAFCTFRFPPARCPVKIPFQEGCCMSDGKKFEDSVESVVIEAVVVSFLLFLMVISVLGGFR